MGLISRQKLKKRTEKNGTFLLKNWKERNVPNGKELGAQPWDRDMLYDIVKIISYILILEETQLGGENF